MLGMLKFSFGCFLALIQIIKQRNMNKGKPNLQAVRKQFSNAKTVTCITNQINVDVTGITEFEYDTEAEIWTSVGGAITFWKNGQYAPIVNEVSKKPCKCENCNCNKGQTVKRNLKK